MTTEARAPSPRPFRFGAGAIRAASGDEWKKLSRRVERGGFSTLHLADHFNDQLSPMPALAMAAAATTTLRVGPLVLCNDFRAPVELAKEVATIDRLSGGRFEWGMGAGWLEVEHQSIGVPFDPPAVRVERLLEAIGLMREVLSGRPTDHAGRYYRTAGVIGTPAPVQQPHPPLLIGGSRPRLLSFAARQADIVGIVPAFETNAVMGDRRVPYEQSVDRQVGWIREAAGARLADLELHMVAFPVVVTDDAAAAWEQAAAAARVPVDDLRSAPHALIGSVEEICETLLARRERWGVSYWTFPVARLDAVAPIVERLAGR
jgi:probable F420-dependent oxidoreductase